MKIKKKLLKTVFLLGSCLCSCVYVTACSSSNVKINESASKKVAKIDSISIKYVGNSCFYITLSDGTRIVTDPYGKSFSSTFAPFPDLTADIITLSHDHSDHNFGILEVKGKPKVILPNQINKTIKKGAVEITGYPTKHVANLGDNTVFVIKAGKYKIVHMGETDTIDSPEAIAAIKDADVVLTYAGEYGTKKDTEVFNFLKQLNVKVMIPQHFSMNPDVLFYGQPTIEQILKEVPQDLKVNKLDELIVKGDMEKQFVVLSPMGKK